MTWYISPCLNDTNILTLKQLWMNNEYCVQWGMKPTCWNDTLHTHCNCRTPRTTSLRKDFSIVCVDIARFICCIQSFPREKWFRNRNISQTQVGRIQRRLDTNGEQRKRAHYESLEGRGWKILWSRIQIGGLGWPRSLRSRNSCSPEHFDFVSPEHFDFVSPDKR